LFVLRSRSVLTRLPAHPVLAYVRRLAHLWWLVVLTVAAAGIAAGLAGVVLHPTYTATAVVALRPAPALPVGTDRVRLIANLGEVYLPNTILKALFSPDSMDVLAAQAGLSPGVAEDYSFSSEVDSTDNTIRLTCSGPDPTVAATYLNEVAGGAALVTQRIYRLISVQVLEPARAPAPVSHPSPARDVPLAMGLGLVLGVLLAALLDYLAE
jgi:capsular polysaccharide biosynthesis protein